MTFREMTKIKINEVAEKQIIDYLISESFIPKADVVLMIKNYLDKNFARQYTDDVEDGYPKKIHTVNMLSNDGQPLKTLEMSEFLLLLDDKFHNIIKDDNDRKAFLKQVIKDWFFKKITKDGILSLNHL